MPHVEIKCFEGRTDRQKTECAEKIALVIAETLGCKTSMHRDIPFEQSHTIEVDNATPIEFSIEELEEIRKRL